MDLPTRSTRRAGGETSGSSVPALAASCLICAVCTLSKPDYILIFQAGVQGDEGYRGARCWLSVLGAVDSAAEVVEMNESYTRY